MRKGQVELVVILALLVVIVVVVVSQMNVFAPTETSDSRLAKESVEGLVRMAAYDTLDRMSMYGGYLSPDDFVTGYVYLNGKEVPYWQQGGDVTYPDKSANFMEGVRLYLEENKADLEASLNNVSLGEVSVSAPVFQNDRITVNVYMPTVIRGVPYNTPYVVTIPTRFSEVYDFGKNFVTYEVTERPLEYFTLSTMFLSPMVNGFHEIPYAEVALDCGHFLFTNSFDVKPKVESAIRKTLAYTYMPGKVPLNTLRTTNHPKYSLEAIGGNSYPSIDMNFELPDDFELTYLSEFEMSPDTITIVAEPVPFTGICMSDPVDINYYVRYPAIMRVKDTETGNYLQFAIDVYIKDNKPGVWSSGVGGYETDEQKEVCEESYCTYNISVTDLDGDPVSRASVKYMGCFLGTTDSSGELNGYGPCGLGMLRIRADGFGEYERFLSYDQLVGAEFQLSRMVPINFIFYEVPVDVVGDNKYMIQYGAISPLEDSAVMMNFLSGSKSFEIFSMEAAMSYNLITEGDYYVGLSLVSSDLNVLEGGLISDVTVSYIDGLEGQTVYVYIPRSINFNGVTDDGEIRRLSALYSSVLNECGIGPLTTEEFVQETACAVTIT